MMNLALQEIALKLNELKQLNFEDINKKISPNDLQEKLKKSGISNVAETNQQEVAKDTLKEKIKEQVPDANDTNIKKIKGNISEKLMDWYFQDIIAGEWEKLEGEVGCNGIDGLYVKRDKNGNIKQVLICESKYNTSQLGETNNGTQMSKEWIQAKLDALQKANLDNKDYATIKEMVNEDKYRARIFRLKEIDGELKIEIAKVDSNGREVVVTELSGEKNNISIDLQKPVSEFQSKVADAYENIVDQQIQMAKGKYENKTNAAA